jgi:hypothetical protein
MPQRRFPRPWRFEPIPGGYRVIDANGLALAHVYGEPRNAIAISDKRLTDDEAEKLARLIVRLPELIKLERERNKAKSRRRSPPPSRGVPRAIGSHEPECDVEREHDGRGDHRIFEHDVIQPVLGKRRVRLGHRVILQNSPKGLLNTSSPFVIHSCAV